MERRGKDERGKKEGEKDEFHVQPNNKNEIDPLFY